MQVDVSAGRLLVYRLVDAAEREERKARQGARGQRYKSIDLDPNSDRECVLPFDVAVVRCGWCAGGRRNRARAEHDAALIIQLSA
jgi:hypothetical protein